MFTYNILQEWKPGFTTWILIDKTDSATKADIIAYRRCVKFLARQLKLPLDSFRIFPRTTNGPMHICLSKEDCMERSVHWEKLPVIAETFVRGFLAGYSEKKTGKRMTNKIVLNR